MVVRPGFSPLSLRPTPKIKKGGGTEEKEERGGDKRVKLCARKKEHTPKISMSKFR